MFDKNKSTTILKNDTLYRDKLIAYLVNEVCCLHGPAFRYILSLDLYLLGKNVITDLLPALANVWTL